ncbi:MAG: hypothetical protein D3914_02415 [Candidatus Electrothrix sp. LOE2]|nr:hypothetical protein [Candidatus Electrothrix sp. LOE2]
MECRRKGKKRATCRACPRQVEHQREGLYNNKQLAFFFDYLIKIKYMALMKFFSQIAEYPF